MTKFSIPFFALLFLAFFASIVTFAQSNEKQQVITKTPRGYKIEVKQGNKTQVSEVAVRPDTSANKQSKPSNRSALSSGAINMAASASGSCPADITVNNDAGKCGAVVNYSTPTCIPKTYTQSTSNIIETGSIHNNCANRYFRAYNLPALGISSGFTISSVDFGASNRGGNPVTVNIYQWNPSTPLSYANFTLLNSAVANIGTPYFKVVNQPISAFIPAGFAVIVEIVGNGTTALNSFFMMGNHASQTAPSYYSLTCDANQAITQESDYSYVINPLGCDAAATITQTQGLSGGSLFPVGTTTNTFKYSDGTTCSFNVTVTDNERPTFTTPDNQNVSLGTNCSLTIPDLTSGLAGSDNCSNAVTFTQSPVAGTIVNSGYNQTQVVIITAHDGHGNTTNHNVTLTAKDNRLPTITAPPAISVYTNAGNCSAINVALGTPTYSDNCSNVTVSSDAPAVFPIGVTTVTWTATDAAGNKATATQVVTVTDNIIPTITAPAAITATTNSGCAATGVTLGTPVTSDNCGVASVTNNAPVTFPIGNTTVTWTVKDNSGNTATATQMVTVTDNTKPTITAPAAITATANSGCAATGVTLGTPVTSDNCGVASVSNNAPATIPIGNTTVTWTVTDNSGNTATATQMITVNDKENPAITCPAATTFCYNASGNYTIANLQATDNCSIASITYAISGATSRSGNGNNASGSFNPGNSTIIWTVKDGSGNTATCQNMVVVNASITVSIPNVNVLTSGVAVNTVYVGYSPAATITLSAQVTGGSGPYTYKWSTNATTSSINVSPATATTYIVTVTDAKGCSGTASREVKVVDVRCGNKMDKVSICHKDRNTLCIDKTDVTDHLAHGDYLGNCNVSTTVSNNTRIAAVQGEVATGGDLSLKASPNLSTNFFKLNITSSNLKDKLVILIMDEMGRTVETRTANPGQTLQIGERYHAGIYFVQAIQGNKKVSVKLIKQAW